MKPMMFWPLLPWLHLLSMSVFAQADVGSEPVKTAEQQIISFHADLIALTQTSEQEARERIITPAVNGLFDVRRIAQVSLGKTWRGLGESDRDAFVALLKELIVVTYADRFDQFNGQIFSHVASQVAGKGLVIKTQLEVPKQTVRLDYFFRDGFVFNVAADGVSDLSLRRADYATIIDQQGYNALVAHLQQKIQEARQG